MSTNKVPMEYNKSKSSKLINYYNNMNIIAGNSSSSVINDICNHEKNQELSSPYLYSEKINYGSKVYGTKPFHKNRVTHSPNALKDNIYKANSDEISKLSNKRKKVKKSVLTLPNDNNSIVTTQSAVSDINKSEYNNGDDCGHNYLKSKKRIQKLFNKSKGKFEYFKCGDELKVTNNTNTDLKNSCKNNNKLKKNNAANKPMIPHNIWSIFKNMNRIHFKQSPVISEENIVGTKQWNYIYTNKKNHKKTG